MNVWRILKPYLPGSLYVEFPKPLCINNLKITYEKVVTLQKLDHIIGRLEINEIIISSSVLNEMVINSSNIKYFWHLLGFVYKRMTVVKKEKSAPLLFSSPHREKVEFLENFINRFRRFPARMKEYTYKNKVMYSLTFPRYLSYITANFLRRVTDKDAIKRFLSECISKKTINGYVQYSITLSKNRYTIYGPLDRLLDVLDIKYSRRSIRNMIFYYIHSESRSLAEEIYNMSIFREVRRRT